MAEASSSSSSAMNTMINAKFKVEKFNGTNNFGMWQCEVLDVLCQQELDVALEEKPDVMDDSEWIQINRQACGTIRLCLAKDQKYSVMRETSAKKLWETLEENYMMKSLENRLYMKNKLYRFTYTPDMSMNDHVNSFNKILADLLNLDEKFEDEDKALLLLNSLPDEYDHLTTTLLHGKDNVTFDAICSALYSSKTKKKDKKDHRDTVAEALTAKDVRYVPSLKKNLISLGVLESKGLTITLRDGLLKVVVGALMVMKGTRRNNLYYFQGNTVIVSASTVSGKNAYSEATKLWHMRLGHTGEKALQTLVKQGLLKGTNSYKLEFCEHCVLGKQTRVKFGSTIHDTKRILDYVHNDTGRKVKRLRSDNGGEYKNDPFLQICQDEGIVRHFTIRDTPQQNGVAECMNQTILEKVRSMLKQNDSQDNEKTSRTLQQMEFEKVKSDPTGVDETNNDSPLTDDDEEVLTHEPSQQQDSIAYRRPRREIHRFARFVDMVAYALPIVNDDVPSTYREAVSNPESIQWKKAMNEEMQSLQKNETWELVTLPKEKKAIGFVKHSSIRILLAMVAQFDLELVQLDVKTAFLHASKNKDEIEKLKTQLNQEFEIKDLGEVKKILGMEICRDRARGKLSAQLSPSTDAEREYMLQVPHSNAVGSLMYAMVCTRPDISHAVGIVSRYMHNPGKGLWQAVKWILRYIHKTMDVGLLFERDDTLSQGVIGYVDSDYAGDLDKYHFHS
ncbi:Integrase catalytic domain-containing protein [Citrus sinensis]|uniref:Integrase catalytic domain-containing protein n=1 Tax=Citrus sinensis TaxID=2711 RepID=A0ACB8IN11_CITSI|nr:Integrase catalytic domain-containing protein [Citrus sinensis]